MVAAIKRIRTLAIEKYGDPSILMTGEEEHSFGVPNTHPRDSARVRMMGQAALASIPTELIIFSDQCEVISAPGYTPKATGSQAALPAVRP